MGCGQPPPGEEGGAKKSGGPLRQIVRTGLVCLCCKALYSRGPQSINARWVWAQTRHNSWESSGIRDARIMYAVRIGNLSEKPLLIYSFYTTHHFFCFSPAPGYFFAASHNSSIRLISAVYLIERVIRIPFFLSRRQLSLMIDKRLVRSREYMVSSVNARLETSRE